MICYVYVMINREVSQLQVITKITTQKKRQDRYNIFLDNVYAFAVDEQVFISYDLRKGLSLSNETIEEIISAEGYQKSYGMAIRYLGFRMRSIKEMETYLEGKEIGRLEIEKIIVALLDKNLLNDEQFANAFVKDRKNQTIKGPIVISRELREKGISEKLTSQALAHYSYEEQYEKVLKWAKKQEERRSNDSHRKQKDQIKLKIMQKGFNGDIVNDVLAALNSEIDDTEERAAIQYHADKLHRRYSQRFAGYELKGKIKTALYARRFSKDLIDEYVEKITDGV